MIQYYQNFEGIIFSVKPYREKDQLCQIFTKETGKRMFFLRRGQTAKKAIRLTPLVRGSFVGHLPEQGFCFIKDIVQVAFPKVILFDIEKQACAGYMLQLVNRALAENEACLKVYQKLWLGLQAMENGIDAWTLAQVFALQMLPYFGVEPIFSHCAICGNEEGAFDYSMKYHGMLCEKHWPQDPNRLHWMPNSSYLVMKYAELPIDKVGQVHLSTPLKKDIHHHIDDLYDEYTGVYLQTNQFLKELFGLYNPLDASKGDKV